MSSKWDSNFYGPHGVDAEYIAAANPQTILALLAERRRLKQQIEKAGICEHGVHVSRTCVECQKLLQEHTAELARRYDERTNFNPVGKCEHGLHDSSYWPCAAKRAEEEEKYE